MRRIILTALLALTFAALSYAQDYKTGLGLRFGTGSGFTVKHFLNERKAIEGLLTTKWHGFDIVGLYEVHNKAFDTDNLRWYYGFGAHVGFYNGNDVEWGTPGSTYNVFGIDGIIGIEYTFDEAPVNIGFDLKPAFNLAGYTGFWTDFGLSVRYVF
ncbi:MAG: hypothetical protein IPN67_04665 [Bacteroidales bacterium]|nr:hypothetical protein [Bacteroidales bacterium]MBK8881685.1 hypothetical protein [Bacteroidales bacterium]